MVIFYPKIVALAPKMVALFPKMVAFRPKIVALNSWNASKISALSESQIYNRLKLINTTTIVVGEE